MLIIRKTDQRPVNSHKCNAVDMPDTLKPRMNREERLIRNAV